MSSFSRGGGKKEKLTQTNQKGKIKGFLFSNFWGGEGGWDPLEEGKESPNKLCVLCFYLRRRGWGILLCSRERGASYLVEIFFSPRKGGGTLLPSTKKGDRFLFQKEHMNLFSGEGERKGNLFGDRGEDLSHNAHPKKRKVSLNRGRQAFRDVRRIKSTISPW